MEIRKNMLNKFLCKNISFIINGEEMWEDYYMFQVFVKFLMNSKSQMGKCS